MTALIFLAMLFLHVLADFNLQGVLAKMKQKRWWAKRDGGKYDYITALIIHGYSWSFMVHIPFALLIFLLETSLHIPTLAMSIIVHAALHAIIDHEKANSRWFNLTEDQIFHVVQLVIIWATIVIALYA